MANSPSGVFSGANPIAYAPTSPYTLFILQMVLIISFAQLLHVVLGRIRQPRVISEVLAGIILGRTAFGKIPGFTSNIFPPAAQSGLTLVSTLGICLLLFMVGCEVDIKYIRKHLPTAFSVGFFNMALPFGLGCAFSVSLWNHYRRDAEGMPVIKFTTFMVFIGVSMCITAFPVLVRILTELRLVRDRVGTVVLAAGITNDLLGWSLLALSITLASSSRSEITGYIVLTTIGWCLFVCYPVRYALRWFLKAVLHDLDNPNGPSTTAMLVILLMMFVSAFFTDIIGVHPIFGAFIMGTVVPRDNNYVIRLTGRIEDLVNIIMAPLYFGIAGLNADLSLLNKGIDWAYIVGLVSLALVGKILGGALAARWHGLFWRESLSVGVLMSCKGIVEIVVLQTGLNSGIISRKLFAMFILMALITTFLTTPMTLLCYPQSYRDEVQVKLRERARKEAEEEGVRDPEGAPKSRLKSFFRHSTHSGNSLSPSSSSSDHSLVTLYNKVHFQKVILPVDSLESVSNNLILVDRLCKPAGLPVHAVNVKTLTDRTADLLHASMMREMDDQFDQFDGQYLNAILSILKIFCELNSVPFTSEILFTLPESFLQTLLDNQAMLGGDLLVVTLSSKFFASHPNLLDNFARQIKPPAEYNAAVFINNKQDIVSSRPAEVQSLLSGETILDPNSFEITSVTLITNAGQPTQDLVVALKLFYYLAKDEQVQNGYIVEAQDAPDLVAVLKEEAETSSKIHQLVSDEESFEHFVLNLKTGTSDKIDELVIVTKSCPFFESMVKELARRNKKILVVY